MTEERNVLLLSGIIRNGSVHNVKRYVQSENLKISYALVPTCWITNRTFNSSNRFSTAIWSQIRFAITTYLTNRKKISRKNWSRVEFSFDLEHISVAEINELLNSIKQTKIYKARSLGTFGIELDKFDLSLEFDLIRNPQNFDLILSEAVVISKAEVPFSRNLRPDCDIRDDNFAQIKGKGHAFHQLFENFKVSSSSPKPHINWSYFVKRKSLGRLRADEVVSAERSSRWKYRTFTDTTVLHGQLVMTDDHFYLMDPSRAPLAGSASNLLPGLIFQDSLAEWGTPKPTHVLKSMPDAILLGGTDNLMHTILEDLPRLIFADEFGVPKRVRVVMSNKVSPPIRELVAKISDRLVVTASPYSLLSVSKLHFFEFTSPLPDIMNGDYSHRDDLMSKEMATEIRKRLKCVDQQGLYKNKRILVLREENLFRRLTNSLDIRNALVSSFNFEPHYLGHLSLSQICELFDDASIIVGEYGAGLGNCIHMKPNTSLVELCGPNQRIAREYKILAEALSINHSLIVGSTDFFHDGKLSTSSYRIDVDEVMQEVASILGRNS